MSCQGIKIQWKVTTMIKICGNTLNFSIILYREFLVNIREKKSRKEAKAKYCQPFEVNSKYAFSIKDRQVKIKKYLKPQPAS